jgi:hypothetical protein
MSTRDFPVSAPHAAPRGYQSIEAVLAHASEHARNRLLHAYEAISWISQLALQRPRAHPPVFSIKGAQVQDASAGLGEQAAHLLAGQILIDGTPPWALAGGVKMKVAWLARFMVTSAVPAPFNAADSAAERAGLKEAFRQACERAWLHAGEGQNELIATYDVFLQAADRAFQKAEHSKHGKRALASSKRDQYTSDERFLEILILKMYRAHGVTAKEASRLFRPTRLAP